MIGADEEQVEEVLGLIREHATSASAPEGSGATQPAAATVFVLDLEEYQRL
jgi:uncharacterized protein YaaQ